MLMYCPGGQRRELRKPSGDHEEGPGREGRDRLSCGHERTHQPGERSPRWDLQRPCALHALRGDLFHAGRHSVNSEALPLFWFGTIALYEDYEDYYGEIGRFYDIVHSETRSLAHPHPHPLMHA